MHISLVKENYKILLQKGLYVDFCDQEAKNQNKQTHQQSKQTKPTKTKETSRAFLTQDLEYDQKI